MRPASLSSSRSPPRTVADASASHGLRPASTSASTSHARWFARREPPPEVSAGRDTYARPIGEAHALDRPLPPTRDPLLPLVAQERGNVVVCAKEAQER